MVNMPPDQTKTKSCFFVCLFCFFFHFKNMVSSLISILHLFFHS